MATASQQRGRDGSISALSVAIEILNIAKEISSITPAKAVFGSVSVLLTVIRDSVVNDHDYVDLGLSCADICKALDRGLSGRRSDELSRSVQGAIEQLTTTVAEIQKKIVKKGNRHVTSRLLHAKEDKDTIAAWKQDLTRILHVFNTELVINTHMMVADMHRNASTGHEDTSPERSSTQPSTSVGEMPPPSPRTCFGRDELIEKVVRLVESLEPIALIGGGGIGKTSIALTVLHHDRIKKRFGDNRRFIRCDQFPASRPNFLARVSKVIGAGVENPEDLTSLRPFLSSQEMLIILDNAESVLDPQGTNAQEIYAVVDELCQFKTISVCITSRITTVPRHCKRPAIPTLSMEAACDIFYTIYDDCGRSDIVNDLLLRLDFHALSITLLATTTSHNAWDYDRLSEEWDTQRAQVLQTDYNESLAATIELSLASPTFRKLCPDARDLLGVVAFFPQGIDRDNLDWLFPTILDRKTIFDKFHILSLTYRSNGFITMLAPIRDYLSPRDPKSSSHLCTTKDHYFGRLSVEIGFGMTGFEETRWIVSEDVNVEHLLNVFTSLDANADGAWHICAHFMEHLYWHKPRQTILRPKIEGLPDDHPLKPRCLFELSRLYARVGNQTKRKQLLTHILRLERERGDDVRVAETLCRLSDVNRLLDFHEEGIQQAKEALEIAERTGDTIGQGFCWNCLAWLFFDDKQLDAAENAASRAIDLASDEGQEYLVCGSHRVLGNIYHSKGKKEKAIHHSKTALEIASPFDWHDQLFWIHHDLALLFLDEGKFGDANAHIEKAKSHAVDDEYRLGRAMQMQAVVLCRQRRLEDARSEALHALEIYDKLGAASDAGDCRDIIRRIERATESRSTSGAPDFSAGGTPSTIPTDTSNH